MTTYKAGDIVSDSGGSRRVVIGHLSNGNAITVVAHEDSEASLSADPSAVYDDAIGATGTAGAADTAGPPSSVGASSAKSTSTSKG